MKWALSIVEIIIRKNTVPDYSLINKLGHEYTGCCSKASIHFNREQNIRFAGFASQIFMFETSKSKKYLGELIWSVKVSWNILCYWLLYYVTNMGVHERMYFAWLRFRQVNQFCVNLIKLLAGVWFCYYFRKDVQASINFYYFRILMHFLLLTAFVPWPYYWPRKWFLCHYVKSILLWVLLKIYSSLCRYLIIQYNAMLNTIQAISRKFQFDVIIYKSRAAFRFYLKNNFNKIVNYSQIFGRPIRIMWCAWVGE